MLIYDVEISSAILGRGERKQEGIKYCQGWKDFVGMGVSTVCCYDYIEDRYRVFCEDNMEEFIKLVKSHDMIVGFNNISFDNNVLAYVLSSPDTNPVLMKDYMDNKSYDILVEIWVAAGLSREFHYPSHIGYSLDAMVKANNLATGKTGNGALAPVWYQEGQYGRLIDYCLADVWLTKKLLDKIILDGKLVSPKKGKASTLSGFRKVILDIKKP